MPALIWGGLAVAGIFGFGWAARETEGAADATTRLVKWGTIAGGLYVGYSAMKAGGLIK